jgi:hypothetical protein
MRLAYPEHSARRRGTVLPMLAVCLVSLFAFTALAIDLGMLAVSRTECQNAADAAALAGCRTLNNNIANANSNLAAAVETAKTVVTSNYDMGANYTTTQISEIDVGQYLYSTSTQTFSVYNGSGNTSSSLGWTNVTSGQSPSPASGSWTAMKVAVSYQQPMMFLTVMGVTSMPTGAVAAAVYRPRDTAFVLDMTSSMAYASQFNYNNRSNNPDTLVPRFGHYFSTRSNCIQTANQYTSDGQTVSQNNYCIYTPGGPPLIRDYVYDPTNAANPSVPAYPITSNTSSLLNAFHRWSPPESGANSASYLGPVYDFTGYNAATAATPAPDTFIDQFDAPGIPYVGDRYPRLDGKVWTTPSSNPSNGSGNPYPLTNPTPAWDDATSGAAWNVLSYLGIATSSAPSPTVPSVPSGAPPTSPSTYSSNWSNFRDPAWEMYGYDLIMGPAGTATTYRAVRDAQNGNAGGTPINPSNVAPTMTFATLTGSGTWTGSNANRFKGYSMGPGYWGKTFFIWPPDPRFSANANPTSPDPNYPAFDTNGNAMCDWRLHFFLDKSGNKLDPQTINVNSLLFSSGASGQTLSNLTSNYQINYAAILKWIKSGPQVLPPNLRAGRILYYSSIPDDVNTATASGQAQLDKVFWKNYINFVLGYGYASGSYLYGQADNWSTGPVSIGSTSKIQYPWESASPPTSPYMNYKDSPRRPRLHFWFGPLSMADFITGVAAGSNWNPGTCHEAQCWQLKVAMNSVITTLQNDHPNDTLGMVMFAAAAYNGPRVAQGQNYTALKNALFYPNSLLSAINGGDTTTEESPYTSSFGNALLGSEIPNANGETDPNTGLAYAFNLLSSSNQLPSTYGSARRGASKLIILETDGVPNCFRGTTGASGMVPTTLGYDTYFPTSTYFSGNLGDGAAATMTQATNVVQQIVMPMAASGQAQGSSANSGLSLPNAPAQVYPIAFGDLFDPNLAPNATIRTTALQFLANVAATGNTGPAGATTLPSGQIIIGDYNTRISTLQTCLQNIFQSGVTVALIE